MVITNKKATLATTTSTTTTKATTTNKSKQQRQTVGAAVAAGTTTWGSIGSVQQKQKQEPQQQQPDIDAKKNTKPENQENTDNNNKNDDKIAVESKQSNVKNHSNTYKQNNITHDGNSTQNSNKNSEPANNTLTTKTIATQTIKTPVISATDTKPKSVRKSDSIDSKENACVPKKQNDSCNQTKPISQEQQLPRKVTTDTINQSNNGNNNTRFNKNAKKHQQQATGQAVGRNSQNNKNNNGNKSQNSKVFTNSNNKIRWKRVDNCSSIIFSTNHHYNNYNHSRNNNNNKSNKYRISNSNTSSIITDDDDDYRDDIADMTDTDSVYSHEWQKKSARYQQLKQSNKKTPSGSDLLTAALMVPCQKCNKTLTPSGGVTFANARQYRKSKSYMGGGANGADGTGSARHSIASVDSLQNLNNSNGGHRYQRSVSDRRTSFDRVFAERNKDFVPIVQPTRPVLASSNIECVLTDTERMTLIERLGKTRLTYPIMQIAAIFSPTAAQTCIESVAIHNKSFAHQNLPQPF
ncbi:putative uncharacterized protein DDB_G0286901 [Anastrepha obliqua]|uniref:putative uncharacterized protein DDB_G0286901 n=1 Tax=Anastrepha obliqua TaxID=95512 RepID=UPI0024095F25|nr:putative uncharacterized protein DDB_G0286901 [Anastrepha obliqua]